MSLDNTNYLDLIRAYKFIYNNHYGCNDEMIKILCYNNEYLTPEYFKLLCEIDSKVAIDIYFYNPKDLPYKFSYDIKDYLYDVNTLDGYFTIYSYYNDKRDKKDIEYIKFLNNPIFNKYIEQYK
jgi:hypothetical protein